MYMQKGNTCVGRLMASTALARAVEEQVLSRDRSSPGTGPTLCFQENTVYFSSLISREENTCEEAFFFFLEQDRGLCQEEGGGELKNGCCGGISTVVGDP
jgi:hypothetical protein